MIIDAHTSVPPDLFRSSMRDTDPWKTVTIPGLLGDMEKSGVDRSVLFSVARKPEHVRGINDFIAGECKKRPDKFIGFANIHPPNLKEALDEIDRAAGELNMAGLKIHPIVQNFRLDHPTVPEVLEKAKEYGLPIIIHVASPVHEYNLEGEIFTEDRALELQRKAENERGGNSAAAYLVKVMDHYDDWNLQSAHMGGIALEKVQKSKISFQTCGATVEGIEYAVKKVGADRIVFGSDFPWSFVAPGRAMEYEVEKVRRANISDNDKEKILGENMRKALNI